MDIEFIDENQIPRPYGVQLLFDKIMAFSRNQIVDFVSSVIMVIPFKGLRAVNAMIVKFSFFFSVGYGVGFAGYDNRPASFRS